MTFPTSIKRTAAAAVAAAALVAAPIFATDSFAATKPAIPPPATPGNVSLVSASAALGVSWTESSGGTITYTATAKAPGRVTRTCSAKVPHCSIASLANGVLYAVTVVAKNAGGKSAPSGPVTGVVGVPTPPLLVRAASGTSSATINWSAPKSNGASSIAFYMATASPGGYSCSTATTVLGGPGRTCQIAGLSSGTTYSVTVSAANSYGTGAPSRPAIVTPH